MSHSLLKIDVIVLLINPKISERNNVYISATIFNMEIKIDFFFN